MIIYIYIIVMHNIINVNVDDDVKVYIVNVKCQPSPGVYFGDAPPVFHLYPVCISPYLWYPVYPCIDLISSHFAEDPLYPAVSHRIQLTGCIRTYLAVSISR